MMKKAFKIIWGIFTGIGMFSMFALLLAMDNDLIPPEETWFYSLPLILVTFFCGLKADLFEF